jgi:hypothetical protein
MGLVSPVNHGDAVKYRQFLRFFSGQLVEGDTRTESWCRLALWAVDEMDIARQSIELGNDQLGLVLLAGRQRTLELWPVVALAARLNKLSPDRVTPAYFLPIVSPNGGTTVPSRMTPAMRDILILAESDSDLWLPAVGVSNSIVDALGKLGWIVATSKGDRVYIQLTDVGRAVLSIAGAT